ncbi:MAG: electron transport complex subunit RsxC [Gammaproteobacteria bacterium]|nr:electron transport complex subunit RsxC [Gammaproteobacteria bacterium]
MFQLSHFKGGLVLDGHKKISTSSAIKPAILPARLTVPLQQHIGHTPELLVQLGDQVLKGQCIAKATDGISASIHAPSSGRVSAIDEQAVAHPSGLKALCVTIETDGKEQWCEPSALKQNYRDSSNQQLLNIISDAGIVGLGGATFPTAIKLQSCEPATINTLIINGAECEPYISCDDMLMRERAKDIVLGIQILQQVLAAKQTVIVVEDNKPQAIQSLQQALQKQAIDNIDVITIPTRYPTGGEKQLIKVVTGKEVPANGLPADIGILCQNVATAYSVYRAVYLDQPLISRIVTVTGDAINEPANFEVLIGTPMNELIAQAGGYTANIGGLVMGGPMMGFSLPNDTLPVTKACNCLLTRVTEDTRQIPAQACIRCGECAEVCPANLLPQQLYWYSSSKNFDRAQDLHLFDCIECGCCSAVCPSHIPLVQYYRFAKTEIWAQEKERKKSDNARQRHEFREARIAREKAERDEKLRLKKELLAKKKIEEEGQQAAVDPKKAVIEAALARVKAKKDNTTEKPKNTDNLTPQQQQKIAEADQRRQQKDNKDEAT